MRASVIMLAAAVGMAGCASSPDRSDPGTRGDRTDDEEFRRALEAARPEFDTQADVLAAGVYESFVHPDSIQPAVEVTADRGKQTREPFSEEGDPTTEELLGTLDTDPPYNPAVEAPRPTANRTLPGRPEGGRGESWTLQMGAFGTETGALVRIRELSRDFGDLPMWYVESGGLYRVYMGRFPGRDQAERAQIEARRRGYADSLVLREP